MIDTFDICPRCNRELLSEPLGVQGCDCSYKERNQFINMLIARVDELEWNNSVLEEKMKKLKLKLHQHHQANEDLKRKYQRKYIDYKTII